jgi:ubiquinone/menaquinone biosynthesis C-methylase UbiE
MSVEIGSRDIAAKYNGFAPWYDYFEAVLGFLGVSQLRQALVSQATGKVLEVAVGTGQNLQYYRTDCDIVAVDLSSEMLKLARGRAAKLNINIRFSLADAEALPFPDQSFDTVVSSLSTCTFPNPANAIQEMIRVSKPSAQLFLLEHGRSDRRWLGQWQDRHADKIAQRFGCHWNREPLNLAKTAGLKITAARRTFLGIFHQMRAAPTITHIKR